MIRIIKLSTGEEIVSDITQENDETLVLKNPCVLQLMQSNKTPEGVSMGMVPYAPYVKDTVTIKRSFVLWVEEPMEDLYNHYNRLFGSGLVVATPGASPGPIMHHRV